MIEVGQKLWYVPHRGDSREVTVTKIGRKWATLDEEWRSLRVDKGTLIADGGQYSSPGRCHLNRAVYEEQCKAQSAWSELGRSMYYGRVPDGMTAADIAGARKLLKI